MVEIACNDVEEESLRLPWLSEVLQNTTCVEPPPQMNEWLPELFKKSRKRIEPQERFLGSADAEKTVDFDGLRKPDKPGVVVRNR